MTSIEGYTEQDIVHLYTTEPQSVPVFHQYLRNCVIYKYVLYIIEMSSYSASTHICYIKIHAEMTEILQVKDCSCYIPWCP